MHADSLSCRSPWKPKTLAARKDLEVVVHIPLAARGKLIPKADLQQSRDSSVRLRIPSPDLWLPVKPFIFNIRCLRKNAVAGSVLFDAARSSHSLFNPAPPVAGLICDFQLSRLFSISAASAKMRSQAVCCSTPRDLVIACSIRRRRWQG